MSQQNSAFSVHDPAHWVEEDPLEALEPIAVVGMACRFPGARTVDELWRNLRDGVESVSSFTDEELLAAGVEPALLKDPAYVKAGAVLEDVEMFDAAFFGLTPREAATTDPQHRLFLECSWEALEDAGYHAASYPGRIGVYAGAGLNTYLLRNLASREIADAGGLQVLIGNDKDFMPTRVSYKLDLKGPSLDVSTACSTSLVAVHLGCQSLLSYQCDMTLAGGASVRVPQKAGYLYQEGGIFSPDGHCRAFDAQALGTVGGSGVGVVVLKRLDDALADGDTVYAVIRATAVNNDGAVKVGYTAPGVDGQTEVVATAQSLAGVDPATVTYVETHGTGTPLGDPVEIEALTQAFRLGTEKRQYCAVGSVKTNFGHLDTAAGVAGLIKTVLALRHRQIPPSLHFETANPKIDFPDSPFFVASELTDWKDGPTPRRAGVSSFGIGGTNAHVVLEEAPEPEPRQVPASWQLLLLSAHTETALAEAGGNLARRLRQSPQPDLADVAFTLRFGRAAFPQRQILVARNTADAASVLESRDPKRLFTHTLDEEHGAGPVAFLFPGQGEALLHAGAGLYGELTEFSEQMDRCAEILLPKLGGDLRRWLFDGNEAARRLEHTALAQPALFTLEYALARQWTAWGVEPDAMLGHSLGEYVAATLAGVFSLEDALDLVTERGRLMGELPPGAMLAVALPEEQILSRLGPGVCLAAVNAPARSVVSGETEAVERLQERLKSEAISCRRLETSHAFHSPMMQPMVGAFVRRVERVRRNPPRLPYLSNLTGDWVRAEEATDPTYWGRHLLETVRFDAGLERLLEEPGRVLLEVGPGATLAAFARRRKAGAPVLSTLPASPGDVPEPAFLLTTLGKLWLRGQDVGRSAFHPQARRVPLPTYPFERRRHWIEPGEPAARPAGKKPDLADWFLVPSWKRLPLPPRQPATPGRWLVFSDACGLGPQIVERLEQEGHQVTTVTAGPKLARLDGGRFVLDPGRDDDYGVLFDELRASGGIPETVLHLWSVAPEETREHALDLGFFSLLALARELGRESGGEPRRILVVSNQMSDVAGEETWGPERASVLGAVRVIPQEYPNVRCHAVDVAFDGNPGARLVEQLLEEASADAPDEVTAYRGPHRFTRTFEPLRCEAGLEPTPRLKPGGVYLITGGLGGIGLTLAEYLAGAVGARLILTGRSPFPAVHEWDDWLDAHGETDPTSCKILRLRALEAAGAEVVVAVADVTDGERMRAVVEEALERFGRIDGAVHAAGVPGGGVIQRRTRAEAERVLAPKVTGTLVLAEALAAADPDFVVLCSSLNAITGGFGQADYAAANAFLDAFASSETRRGGPFVVSVNWGAWSEVGMAAAAEESLARTVKAAHPLFDERRTWPHREAYVTRFRPDKHWVLDEHRIGGTATLPGTAYLEMFRAALDGAFELRDVFFLAPLTVDDGGERETHTLVEENGAGWVLSIRSRNGDGWLEHARARAVPAGDEPPVRQDLREIEAKCANPRPPEPEAAAGPMQFGPRWRNLSRLSSGEDQALAELELPAAFAADAGEYALHPALLDTAVGFAKTLADDEDVYLPFSYEKVRVRGPMPSKVRSHARWVSHDRFDVTVLDEEGRGVVEIEGYTLRRADASRILPTTGAPRPPAPARDSGDAASRLREALAMTPAEGVEAFRRILGTREPQIVVATHDLTLHDAPAAPEPAPEHAPPGPSHPRPELHQAYVAPRGETEEKVAALWQELIGIDRVGAHDDFFELGGDSLLATQVLSRLRDLFHVDLPLASLFEKTTVAELAGTLGRTREPAPSLPAIPRIPRDRKLRLSPAQQRLWLLDQLHGADPVYNFLIVLWRIRGPLRRTPLVTSLSEVVRRHEVLRTTFGESGGEPVQVIAAPGEVPLLLVDLDRLPEEQRLAAAWRSVGATMARPFDLSRGPLLRFTLLRLGPREHVLVGMTHHILIDEWSVAIFVRELAALYEGRALPELPLQYADFAHWQRRRLREGLLKEQLTYWEVELADASPKLDLPTDRPRPVAGAYRGSARHFSLGEDVARPLKDLGRRQGTTAYMTLLTAYVTLLSRWSGQQDLLVGSPTANRTRLELEDLIGFFVNMLVLRADLSGQPTFQELLARMRRVALDAHEHQEVPFDQVVEALRPERSLSHMPLFQVAFIFRNTPVESARLHDLELVPLGGEVGTTTGAAFDLTLSMVETASGFEANLEYNRYLFDDTTVHRMARQLRTLLAGVAAPGGEERRLTDLPWLPAAERHQLLVEWNEPDAPAREPLSIYEAFTAQVARAPGAVAVTCGGERLTYAELEERARRVTRRLLHLDAAPEVRIGLFLERSPEMVAAVLGVLGAGATYVPLDVSYPAERVAYILEDGGIQVLLTQESLLDRLPEHGAQVVCLDDGAPVPDAAPASPLPHPENLAYVIYTSGSTGRPKGVGVTHRNVLRLFSVTEELFRFGAEDVWTLFHSVAFDFSVWEIFGALLHGGRLVIVPWEVSRSSEAFYELVCRERVSVLNQTPSAFEPFLRAAGKPAPPSLRAVVFGGEALDPRKLRAWQDGPALVNMYGITETTVHVTYHPVSRCEMEQPGSPIGRRLRDLGLVLLDGSGQPVPLGAAGEIFVGGAGLARGYLGRPALTAERFVPDPSSPRRGERLYRTGDLARRLPDGRLLYLGRIDHQVKIRGYRIEPGEIESALAGHPDVRDAVVTVREDSSRGPGLVAYVTGTRPLDVTELRGFLREKLPDYMVPGAFVTLPELPRTPHGKVDRDALPAPEEMPQSTLTRSTSALRTATEEILAGIWTQVLGVEPIAPDDDFFDLGGHSLLATQVLSRVRDAFSFDVPVRRLFESPTLEGLAAWLDAARREKRLSSVPPIRRRSREGDLPLSHAQERLWFLDELVPENAFYNIPVVLRLVGRLDAAALKGALTEILRRHEALRTTFVKSGGRPWQRITAATALPLPVVDLRRLDGDAEARRLATAEMWRPFDLSADRMLRATLLRLADEEHVALLTLHHIAADGWSIGVFVAELSALYEAAVRGVASPLPELRVQYADFAGWQREWLAGEVLEAQLDFWKRQLSGASPVLELPADHRRPPVASFRGGRVPFELDPGVTAGLLALSRRSGASLFMTLLAGCATLLSRHSGQQDVLIGAPVANRNYKEIEALIGFFVNTLALRVDLTGAPAFTGLLSRVRDRALDAYAHQDLPFEQLVDELRPQRHMNRNPLVQVTFALQNAPAPPFALPDLTLAPIEVEGAAVRFDLEWHVWELQERVGGYLLYSSDLFDPTTARRLVEQLRTLLASIAEDPSLRLRDLDLLPAAQRHQLVAEWRGGRLEEAVPGAGDLLHERFEAAARRFPEATAVTCQEERLSYRELSLRSTRLAHRLRTLGVEPETRVGLCVERSLELVVGILAVLKAGGAYLPLDPTLPGDRLAFMIRDSGLGLVLIQEKLRDALGEPEARLVFFEGEDETAGAPEVPLPTVAPENAAYVIYTSGSTGKPKGVVVSHANVIRLFRETEPWFRFDENDVWTLFHSYAFDFSVWELWGALFYGGRLVVVPYWVSRSPEDFHHLLLTERVTVLSQTPSAFRQLIPAAAVGHARRDALRVVVFGGEALELSSLKPWFERFGDRTPRLINMYGITETTVHVTYLPLQSGPGDETGSAVGRPIPDLKASVTDGSGRPVPAGVPGELRVGGPGLARGYLHRPGLTAARFVPGEGGGRLYRTGDLARFRGDGTLEYLGRIDHQVQIRGFRIEPGEIEAVLEEDSAVRQAVVQPWKPPRADAAALQLVAYVVPGPESDPAGATVARESRNELLSQWEQVFQESYAGSDPDGELDFNIVGWNSSYTQEPIPREEMREWVEHTVERILSRRPTRVLEIGCGTGLLLSRIAPHCSSYCGTDFSQEALRYIERLRESRRDLDHVVLKNRMADDFTDVEAGAFDAVILNSVAQYFPGVHYLLNVLRGAFEAVADGGFVFVGDVRSLPLLRACHASFELHKADASLSLADFGNQLRHAMAREEELLLDPGFFAAVEQRFARVRQVKTLLKRGRAHNEMTRFRYDVFLELGQAATLPAAKTRWLDWRREELTLAEVRRILVESKPDSLGLHFVPDARVAIEMETLDALADVGVVDKNVGDFREKLAAWPRTGVDPEELWALGEELSYHVEIGVSPRHGEGSYDVLLSRWPASIPSRATDKHEVERPWELYANDPLREKFHRKLVPRLREAVRGKLPEYMMPASFEVLESLPLTANGKVDRRALPAPRASRSGQEAAYVAPRAALELALARIWEKVLNVEKIGVKDNFFDLGGHSLLAVSLMTLIEQELGKKLPLATLFEGPTIEQLAGVLNTSEDPLPWTPIVAIQPSGSKPPLFCVHPAGGTVLCYVDLSAELGLEQPFYGLEYQGLDPHQELMTSVEELAACYVEAVLERQPRGPYFLCGWSSGVYKAFEMAQQLYRQGEEVAFLGLIDAPAVFELPEEIKNEDDAAFIVNLMGDVLGLSLEELRRLGPDEQLRTMIDRSIQAGILPPHFGLEQARRTLDCFKANRRAVSSYQSQPYPGKINLFRCSEEVTAFDGYSGDETMGWGALATGGVEVRWTSGNHNTLLRQPHVRGLAEKFGKSLDEAQRRSAHQILTRIAS